MAKKHINFFVRLFSMMLCVALVCSVGTGCKGSGSGDDGDEYYTSTIKRPVDNNNADGEEGDTNEESNTNTESQGTDSGQNTSAEKGEDGKSNSNGSKVSSKAGTSNDKNLDDVPTKGKTFTICSAYLPTKESEDNTLFERVFLKRVREVEKEYGITIKIVNSIVVKADQIASFIRAGKPVANILETDVRNLPPMIAAGYLKPWNKVDGVNVNNPNFFTGYTNAAKIGGNYYGLQFEKPPEVRYCMVMNKNLLKQKNIDPDGIYNMIEQKKWDFTTFLDYAKRTTNAGNGIYGVGGNPEYVMEMLLSANNAQIVTLNANGKATPTYTSQNVVKSLEFMNQLINTDKVFYTTPGMHKRDTYAASMPDYINQFIQGKLTFLMEDSWVLNQRIRPKVKNFDYGMIPVPLGPSATNYICSSGHARVWLVTSTNKELDFTAKIFNALAELPAGYSGNDWWKDEIQLDYFQNNDTKSLKIYTDLLNNMVVDHGFGMSNVFSSFENKVMYEPMFWSSGKTVSAAVDSIKGTFDKAINDMFN